MIVIIFENIELKPPLFFICVDKYVFFFCINWKLKLKLLYKYIYIPKWDIFLKFWKRIIFMSFKNINPCAHWGKINLQFETCSEMQGLFHKTRNVFHARMNSSFPLNIICTCRLEIHTRGHLFFFYKVVNFFLSFKIVDKRGGI